MIKNIVTKLLVEVTEKPLSGIMLILFSGGMLIGEAYRIAVGPDKQKQL